MAGIRIAVVTWKHEPLEISEQGVESIGDAVNSFIDMELKEGNLVSQVALEFDEGEQYKMREWHLKRHNGDGEYKPTTKAGKSKSAY